ADRAAADPCGAHRRDRRQRRQHGGRARARYDHRHDRRDARVRASHGPVGEVAAMSARVPGRPSKAVATTVICAIGLVFVIPLLAMLEFTLRQVAGGYGAEHWLALFDPENARKYRILFQGICNSFVLAGLSLVIV